MTVVGFKSNIPLIFNSNITENDVGLLQRIFLAIKHKPLLGWDSVKSKMYVTLVFDDKNVWPELRLMSGTQIKKKTACKIQSWRALITNIFRKCLSFRIFQHFINSKLAKNTYLWYLMSIQTCSLLCWLYHRRRNGYQQLHSPWGCKNSSQIQVKLFTSHFLIN